MNFNSLRKEIISNNTSVKELVKGIFDKIEFSYDQAKNWKIHLNEEKGISVNPDSINIEAEDLSEYRIIGNGIQIF